MLASALPDLVRVGPFPRPDEFAASDSFRLLPALESSVLGAVGEVAKGAWDDEADDRLLLAFWRLVVAGSEVVSVVGDMLRGPKSSLRPLPLDFGLVATISGSSSTSIAVSCRVAPGAVLIDFRLPCDLVGEAVLKKRALSEPTTTAPSAIVDLTGIMSWLSASKRVIPAEETNEDNGLSKEPGSYVSMLFEAKLTACV